MCKCNCEEDRREVLVQALKDIRALYLQATDGISALRQQAIESIHSIEAELKMLDKMDEAKQYAYESGCRIKATLDSFVAAGLSEEQALAVIIAHMNGAEVHVEL